MAVFGFDIDGTLTHHSLVLGEIMKGLKSLGHQCIVITGCLSSSPTSPQARQAQLALLEPQIMRGIHYDELLVVEGPDYDDVGRGKGQLLAARNAVCMFEDTPQWLPLIRESAKGTSLFLAVNI